MDNPRYGWVERILRRLLAPVIARQEAALGQVEQEVRSLREQMAELVRRVEGTVSGLSARQDDLTRVQERLVTELIGQTRRQDEIVRVQERLADEIRGVTQRHEDLVSAQRNVMQELEGVKAAQRGLEKTVEELAEALSGCKRRDDDLVRVQEELAAVVRGVENGHRALVQVQEEMAERLERMLACEQELGRALEGLREDITGVTRREDALVQVQEELAQQLRDLWEKVGNIDRCLAGEAARIEDLAGRVARGEGACEELRGELVRMREDTSVLKGVIGGALEQLEGKRSRRRQVVAAEVLGMLDECSYWRFEGEQRGSEEEIRGRLRWYLQWLRGVETTQESYILDVGCGRGEFVELLLEEGLHARGVDVNQIMVAHARGKGLPVQRHDLFEVLKETGNETLAGIAAFHVLEHMPPRMQVKFLRLAYVALRPGGVLMLEFPNILSLRVAATDFYKDPTHLRPLHPVTVEGWLRDMGFTKIHVEFLHPYPDEECGRIRDELSQGESALFDVVYGNRDCAVVAFKAEYF